MGRPELAENLRYATHTARGAHQVELDNIISDWTSTLGREELGQLLDQHGVPRGDIYRVPEMLEDAHFKARQAIIDIPHPAFGSLKMQNVAPKLSDTPGCVLHAGPDLGEHNRDILEGLLGYSREQIATLATRQIVGALKADAA